MTAPRHDSPTWISDLPGAAGTRLVRVPAGALAALAVGDLTRAQEAQDAGWPLPAPSAGSGPSTTSESRQPRPDDEVVLTPFLVSDRCRQVWGLRSRQVAEVPSDADWVTPLVVAPDGQVVGRAGFHGAPEDGTVEVGYEIDPLHRRQGHARAALLVMLDLARREPDVRTLRASIRPDNLPSRRLVEQHGLLVTGEQWDDEDGLETIFEIDVRGDDPDRA